MDLIEKVVTKFFLVVDFDYALHRVYNPDPLMCSPARLALVGDPPGSMTLEKDPKEGSQTSINPSARHFA
jgi:hypothetical protein